MPPYLSIYLALVARMKLPSSMAAPGIEPGSRDKEPKMLSTELQPRSWGPQFESPFLWFMLGVPDWVTYLCHPINSGPQDLFRPLTGVPYYGP